MKEQPAAANGRPPGDDKRPQLIEAAAQVIMAEGVAAATTRRIADEAGLPSGLIHYWFADKDELMEAVIVTLHDDLIGQTEEARDTGATVAEAFQAVVDIATIVAPGRQLAIYELMLWALRTPSVSDVAQAQRERRTSAITAYLEPYAGTIEASFPGGVSSLSSLLAAVFDGIVLTWLATEDRERLEGAVSTLDFLMAKAGL